jgi:hypothetical protein
MSQGKDFVVTEYAKALVQAKARQLYHRRGFSPGEQRDIEQELWLVVLEKAQRFDPARPQLETFLDCVVSRGTAVLLLAHAARSPPSTGSNWKSPPRRITSIWPKR